MIMRANEEYFTWDTLKGALAKLLKAVEEDDYPQIRLLLREVVTGYVPEGEIVDWIYQQRRVEPGE
ncbi:nucleotide sugar epimerase/dehydratase WbpM [Pseudomonas sp. BAY1663]|nr:nucleotide sugar epimerase/dehydratase WbpM [Pseudomonas sp. BAY1663]